MSDRTRRTRRWVDARAAHPSTPWIGLVIRLVLGGFILWASLAKLTDPYASVVSVRAYDLLPEPLVKLVGYSLPVVELLVALCLLLGLITRVTAVFAAGLMVVFVIGIASVWARGMEIDCGCFGSGGPQPGASSKYPWEIARDVGFFLMAGWLFLWPRTRYALDNLLFPRTLERIPDAEEVR
ncbi:MAG TPA: MauE/DoxX family redox-associated membrane protein [Nocardioides sp.]|uniref:MauE/DoxX family redox-associated membrane protein n=1 Tax=Nocardioides sp. TaxID=35761 RepID=UPI002BA317A6|nr:MauE/DoxX family redox-associated membrane protein [Nocardioides sp.]HQR26843.1 MauE/DoxX family redox-associated membrane protein [Nocardioides sp.]